MWSVGTVKHFASPTAALARTQPFGRAVPEPTHLGRACALCSRACLRTRMRFRKLDGIAIRVGRVVQTATATEAPARVHLSAKSRQGASLSSPRCIGQHRDECCRGRPNLAEFEPDSTASGQSWLEHLLADAAWVRPHLLNGLPQHQSWAHPGGPQPPQQRPPRFTSPQIRRHGANVA